MASLSTHRPGSERSNEEWLRTLEARDPDVVSDLRDYLRRGLARSFGQRDDVTDGDLDDFAQDATVRVIDKLETFAGNSKFTTWAMAVAVRVVLNQLRRRNWTHRSLEEVLEGSSGELEPRSVAGDPGLGVERQDLLAALNEAVENALTERQRTLIRAELAGVPNEEIARQMETNANALYKLYHDARRKLRQALNEAGFSDEDVRAELAGVSEE